MPDDDTKDELMESLSKGNFTMRILYEQFANVQKMGSVGQIMSMIPGLSNSGVFNKVCLHFHSACATFSIWAEHSMQSMASLCKQAVLRAHVLGPDTA